MSKITESARGEACTMRIPGVCNHDRATVVWCHRNGAEFKGIGQKSHDLLGAYGCSACHDAYDRRVPTSKFVSREMVDFCFDDGHARSLLILIKKGLVR